MKNYQQEQAKSKTQTNGLCRYVCERVCVGVCMGIVRDGENHKPPGYVIVDLLFRHFVMLKFKYLRRWNECEAARGRYASEVGWQTVTNDR